MKKFMIFWLIFKFCLMILTMHAEIMDLINKILRNEKIKSKSSEIQIGQKVSIVKDNIK